MNTHMPKLNIFSDIKIVDFKNITLNTRNGHLQLSYVTHTLDSCLNPELLLLALILTAFSTDLYTTYVYNLCGHTLNTNIFVLVQLFKTPWSLGYPKVKDPTRKLSETTPVKKK